MNSRLDLENYLRRTPTRAASRRSSSIIELESQEWRGLVWRHQIHVLFPSEKWEASAAPIYLYAAGRADVETRLALLARIGRATGAPVAIVTEVPNQPLMGLEESALLAYTLSRYGAGEDFDWPLLFPMAKSLIAAMDALCAELGSKGFILSGSSKRAWAAWLAAAIDRRVLGLASISFELIGIPAQLRAAREAYGSDSESLSPFSTLGLTDEALSRERGSLVEAVDPVSFSDRLTMPKLIVTGANDPFWILDSHRHYLGALRGPSSVLLVPGAGHDAAADEGAQEALASWCAALSRGDTIPRPFMRTELDGDRVIVEIGGEPPPSEVLLYSAYSRNRDFRGSRWTAHPVQGGRHVIEKPRSGYIGLFSRCGYSECSLKLGTHAVVL